MIYNLSGNQRADCCTQTVGHQHKQALRGCTNFCVTFLVDKQAAGDIKEVECHTVDKARKDEQNHAGESGVAESQEAETANPRKHGDEHNRLDAIAFQEERNEQDAEGFRYLRNRNQERCIVGCKRIGKFGKALEVSEERSGKTVSNLQRHAEEHREDEE